MSYLRDQNDDALAGKDHELTLSTAAIFGIFFGLVLLCAIFFGFGYSLGGHKSPVPPAAETASAAPGTNFSTFKPAAGQPVGASSTSASGTGSLPVARPVPEAPPAPVTVEDAPEPAPVVHSSPAPASVVAHPVPAAATSAAPVPAGLFVQVAAISVTHPDDASLMVNALRAKGYAASAHPAPDNFIHILIGPFAARPAAETMLKRLSADGYTAYIK